MGIYLVMAIAAGVGMLAQWRLKSAYAKGVASMSASGITGRETAQKILDSKGITNVGIEMVQGKMSDHYDPKAKMLRLSSDVYQGSSLAALGIAAHEVGHAIQDAENYGALVVRNGIVPFANAGGSGAMIVFMIGAMMQSQAVMIGGVGLFGLVVLFQLINLPVEFNASSRAKSILLDQGMINEGEYKTVDKVLDAAALTYVAATVSTVLYFLYYAYRAGLIGGRRN